MNITTDNATGQIVFSFDGATAPVSFDVNKAHFDLCIHAMMKAFENRIKDTAAIPRKQNDGTIITVTEDMRRAKVVEMIDHIESGTDQWNLKSSGTRTPPKNPTILAIAAKLGVSYEQAEAKLAEQFLSELSE